ncbi:MAG: hypothetical protein K6B14_10210 [Lachnospiraceae bacterium]|nr:hypothetical protein [Lachnospiraceae bacterium]
MKMRKIIGVIAAVGLVCNMIGVFAPVNVVKAATSTSNLSNATTISAGKTVTGSLSNKQKNKSYKFTAPGSGYLDFYIERAEVKSTNAPMWKATIYDGNGTVVCDATETTFYTNAVMVEKDSVYYLDISNASNATDEKYQITAEFTEYDNVIAEPNTGSTDAKSVSLGTTYLGVMDKANDEDYIRLYSDTTGYVKMSLKKYVSSSASSADWGFTLYDSEMNQLYNLTSKYQTDSLNTEGLYVILQAGKPAYVRISGSNNTAGVIYSFDTSFTPSSLVESEPNNSFASADKIKLKKTYRAALAETATGDYYVYKATKASKHVLKVTLSNEIAKAYRVTVYDKDRNPLVSKDNVFKNGKLSFKTKKGQKYYILVEHMSGYDSELNALYKLQLTAK